MKGKLAGTVTLGATVLAAGMLAAFGLAADGGGPPNQGDPDKVTSVLSGYVCSGTVIWRSVIQGDGQAKTVTITETLPIVEVRVKSGSKAALVSAVFSGNFLSATVTISQGVSNYAWSVCQPGDTTTTDTTTTGTTTTDTTTTTDHDDDHDDNHHDNARHDDDRRQRRRRRSR